MGDKRQKNQLQMVLAFTDEGRSEAPKARREGTESLTAKRACESPAIPEQMMEEVCDRENLKRALQRVKSNKGGRPSAEAGKGPEQSQHIITYPVPTYPAGRPVSGCQNLTLRCPTSAI